MKQTKTRLRPNPKRRVAASKRSARKIAWHKRLVLHPLSIFLLLCTGVLIVGLTVRALADSYTVTGVVPAAPITQPATIAQPAHNVHVLAAPLAVTGSCPDNSYIKLYRNDAFSGAAICVNSTYNITTDLSFGANVLLPRVYNTTDTEGPAAQPAVVYYDPPAPSMPAVPPTILQVTNVEGESHQATVVQQVAERPTVRGVAPPFAHIIVTFHSNPLTCETDADVHGNWECTLEQSLPAGSHIVEVAAHLSNGQVLTLPKFSVVVVSGRPPLQKTKSPATPLSIHSDYTYQASVPGRSLHWTVNFANGKPTYELHVEWGDGTSSTVEHGDNLPFSITHAFRKAGTFTIRLEGSDSEGSTAFLQFAALVHKPGQPATIIGSVDGSKGSPFTNLHTLLWIVWPSYVAVVLMAISFYLGEREEYHQLFFRRHAHKRK